MTSIALLHPLKKILHHFHTALHPFFNWKKPITNDFCHRKTDAEEIVPLQGLTNILWHTK